MDDVQIQLFWYEQELLMIDFSCFFSVSEPEEKRILTCRVKVIHSFLQNFDLTRMSEALSNCAFTSQ